MDIKDLIEFCKHFDIDQNKLDSFLEKKKIIEKNNNFYLIDNNSQFGQNHVFQNNLIFIKLSILLPSMYLLNFLKSATKPVRMKSPKQAINFTYGKSLHLDSIIRRKDFIELKHYILTCDDDILGIIKLDSSQRFSVLNIMNIGEYLKE